MYVLFTGVANSMPYGHVNATAAFQRVMDKEILATDLSHTCKLLLDDISLFSDDVDTHLSDLNTMLRHPQYVGIKMQPENSILMATTFP